MLLRERIITLAGYQKRAIIPPPAANKTDDTFVFMRLCNITQKLSLVFFVGVTNYDLVTERESEQKTKIKH